MGALVTGNISKNLRFIKVREFLEHPIHFNK